MAFGGALGLDEFLQRLETYRGVVICTTNLVEDLDQAAMRRFPFKVRFDWNSRTLSQFQRRPA